LAACIFFVGLGIGGEYSAMNSAINEVRAAPLSSCLLFQTPNAWFFVTTS
jgi:hypothetical protein